MGSEISTEELSMNVYEHALEQPSCFPNVVIDESLLKYSGLDSNSVLQTYSDDLVNSVPGYVEKLGSSLASLKVVPNAVGLGALVLSMIMEICMKSSQTNDDSYSLFRRVFGEEKASAVRDTMSQYVKRHHMFINNEQRLLEELRRLERQLSDNLVNLRNSLLHDGQMSNRGFKIWLNGAFFHVQMLIHEARLNTKPDQQASHYVDTINAAITLYLQNLDHLLEKYKTYKISTMTAGPYSDWYGGGAVQEWFFRDTETKLNCIVPASDTGYNPAFLIDEFVTHIFSKYEPITGLKANFSNIKNNLDSQISQHEAFFLPHRA